MNTNTISIASHQWAIRPADQRFLTLESLLAYKTTQREFSRAVPVEAGQLPLKIQGREADGQLTVGIKSGDAHFTNWSFGQLASLAGAPAGYLSTLPTALTKACLDVGLKYGERAAEGRGMSLLFTDDPDNTAPRQARALTSQTYGRIWDQDVVQSVVDLNERQDGRWRVPVASYSTRDPKRATTLYASDRDVFMFLVDPSHPVDAGGEDQLFRGFMVWNSEVGSATFGLMTFLYRYVCDNRIVWGAQDVSQLLIRHTKGGPSRFLTEALPTLQAYSEGSAAAVEAAIRDAKAKQLAKSRDEVQQLLITAGFAKPAITVGLDLAVMDDKDPTNLWDVVQGMTAYARTIEHQDSRVKFERQVGQLMNRV